MIDPELRSVVERLGKAGTPFESVCVRAATRELLPTGFDIVTAEANTWDVDWVPNFTLLPAGHPDAEFVADQMSRFYGDPLYGKRLAGTAGEMDMDAQEAEYLRRLGDDDAELPDA